MNKICPRCQNEFETEYRQRKYCTVCGEYRSSKKYEKYISRPFTIATPFLCSKWRNEGDSVRTIAYILQRPEKQIREAIAQYEHSA